MKEGKVARDITEKEMKCVCRADKAGPMEMQNQILKEEIFLPVLVRNWETFEW